MLYGKFGRSISKKFLEPYNEKLYACNLDNLDQNAMGRFFPYAELDEIISCMRNEGRSSYNEYFMYPKDGADVFVKALLSQVNGNRLLLNEELVSIDADKKVAQTNKRKIKYEYLINTIPLNAFCKLMKIEGDLSSLSNNKVLVFNLGFDKKSDMYRDIHWVYVPSKEINFYRVGFYDNILNQNRASLYVEIGFPRDFEIDIERQLILTLANLKKMNIITETFNLEAWCYKIMDPAYVYLSSESLTLTKKILIGLKDKNIFCIGRYGRWRYCSIEDCMIDALDTYNSIER